MTPPALRHRTPGGLEPPAPQRVRVFNALAAGRIRPRVLALALALLEADPLISAGAFPGDLLRCLMELPGGVWAREPALYQRYQAVLRAAALARMRAPEQVRRSFWGDLPPRVPGT